MAGRKFYQLRKILVNFLFGHARMPRPCRLKAAADGTADMFVSVRGGLAGGPNKINSYNRAAQ
jgi:hypothetical protein